MFLTDKQRPVMPLFPAPSRQQQQLPALVSQSHSFHAALSSRLLSLLPIPSAVDNNIKTSCIWLSRASHLLSLTLSHALQLLPSSTSPSPLLDSTALALLHSCNSLSAFSHALLRRLLFLRFSLQSHNPTVIFPQKKPLPELTPLRLQPLPPPPHHGKIDSVQNVIYAVEAVSALVIGAIWVTLSGKVAEHLEGLKAIDAEIFPWGKDFNNLLEAVSKRIREEDRGCSSMDAQLAKMEATTTMMMMVGEGKGGMDRSRLEAIEAACEEMREGLEKLEAAVNALFQAALCARNAALPP